MVSPFVDSLLATALAECDRLMAGLPIDHPDRVRLGTQRQMIAAVLNVSQASSDEEAGKVAVKALERIKDRSGRLMVVDLDSPDEVAAAQTKLKKK
jgi:hypothetical protein